MAAIGHLPFVLTNASSSLCQSTGRSLFHTSLDSQYDNRVLSENTVHNSISSNGTTTNSSPSPVQVIVRHLQEAVNLCNIYIKELSNVCTAGVQTAQFLTTSIKEISKLAENDQSCISSNQVLSQKLADDYAEAWGQLSAAMKSAIETMQRGVFSALHDVIGSLEGREKNLSCNIPLFASESNKVLITSLLTLIHLQYEFSLYMCETLFDLVNFNPECFDANLILIQESSKNGSNKLSEFLTAYLDSLAGLQRHFSDSLNNFRLQTSFHSGVEVENFPPKTGPSSNPEIPFQKHHLFTSVENFPFDSSWPVLPNELTPGTVLNKPKQLEPLLPPTPISVLPYMMPSSNQSQTIWSVDSMTESPWAFLEKSTEAVHPLSKEEKQKSVFASHEELQDVIGLLSCQTSNPSSPTSESSVSSHYQTTNSETKTSFLWPNGKLNHNSTNYYRLENGIGGGFSNFEGSKHSKSWPCENNLSSVWNSSVAQESSASSIKPSYNHLSDSSFNQFPQSVDNSDLIQNYGIGLNAQRLSAINNNNQCRHLRAAKSTSWPVVGSHAQSSSDQDEGISNKLSEKGNNFFMGIQLVGNDLMASVRQRRHSSGSSFPENFNYQTYSPSVRTKSIDNIVMEKTCDEMAKCSLKPDAPGNPLSSLEKQSAMSNGNSLWHFGNLPQGLPPSGIENRNKYKIERKYSLFGQAV